MRAPSFFYLETLHRAVHFLNFRLDILIGLKINFDVRAKSLKWLIMPVKCLKMPLSLNINVYFD